MNKNLKILGVVTGILIVIAGIVFGFFWWVKYDYEKHFLQYDNINNIQYAEPTEEAKNFNIDGYISKLPEVEYEKIDYPVKETYTYKFNNYEMTIDIPEGFEVKEIPLEEKPKIVNSTSIEDSYDPDSKEDPSPANGDWIHGFVWEISDSYLCLTNQSFFESMDNRYLQDDKHKCVISFTPDKSLYKGVSARDIFINRDIKHCAKKEKFKNMYETLFLASNDTCSKKRDIDGAAVLLGNNQLVVTGVNRYLKNNKNIINLFFSVLNTVNIQKKK